MSVAIVGLGTWLPETVRFNDAWPPAFARRECAYDDRTFNDIPTSEDALAAQILARDLAAETLDPFLGATRRHVADPSLSAGEAEALAAQAALADAGLAASSVDLVISNSAVPDRIPSTAAPGVAHRIGATRALAIGIEAGCASAVVQLSMARAYIEAGLARVALLTQSHLLLRAFPLLHPACPGLGDAATAMVVARGPGLELCSSFALTHGEHRDAVTFRRGDDDMGDLPWWREGGDFRLGSRVPAGAKLLMRETVSFGAATVREAARRANLPLDRIAVLASVQPRAFIPGAIAERLGLPRERAVTTYDRIAHVGGTGVVFNLIKARTEGRPAAGDYAALYAQGAGFTRAAAIVRVAPPALTTSTH